MQIAIRFAPWFVSITLQQPRREVINAKRTRKINYDCMFVVNSREIFSARSRIKSLISNLR